MFSHTKFIPIKNSWNTIQSTPVRFLRTFFERIFMIFITFSFPQHNDLYGYEYVVQFIQGVKSSSHLVDIKNGSPRLRNRGWGSRLLQCFKIRHVSLLRFVKVNYSASSWWPWVCHKHLITSSGYNTINHNHLMQHKQRMQRRQSKLIVKRPKTIAK